MFDISHDDVMAIRIFLATFDDLWICAVSCQQLYLTYMAEKSKSRIVRLNVGGVSHLQIGINNLIDGSMHIDLYKNLIYDAMRTR